MRKGREKEENVINGNSDERLSKKRKSNTTNEVQFQNKRLIFLNLESECKKYGGDCDI